MTIVKNSPFIGQFKIPKDLSEFRYFKISSRYFPTTEDYELEDFLSSFSIHTEQATLRSTKNKIGGVINLGEALNSLASYIPPLEIYPTILENSVGFVFGVPKSGKTCFCENLLLSIAAGRSSFFGHRLNANNRATLFISLEEFYLKRLLRNQKQLGQFSNSEQEEIKHNYRICNQDFKRSVYDRDEWHYLEEHIALHNPIITVIDSLSRLTPNSNADEETAKKIMLRLREIAQKNNTAIIIINHTPKGRNEHPLDQFSMSGSRILMQDADFILGINHIRGARYIKTTASRYSDHDHEDVDIFELTNIQGIKKLKTVNEESLFKPADGRENTDKRELILEAIKKLNKGNREGIEKKDVLKALPGISTSTFYHNLKKMNQDNIVEIEGSKIIPPSDNTAETLGTSDNDDFKYY
jgi:RecA-family ATPase